LDAQYNWYGDVTGPSGGVQDAVDPAIVADGFGAMIVDLGPINFAPYLGINAVISTPAAATINAEVGEPVLFDATGSTAVIFEECCDPFEATHMQYEWDFDDGAYSHIQKTTHVFNSPGTYHVRLMMDSPGFGWFAGTMFSFDYVDVIVEESGSSLAANADGENLGEYEGIVGDAIQFYGVATGGNGRYFYSWDLGDGAKAYVRNPIHAYKEAGEYTVTLTVTDESGNVATDTSTVVVSDIEELFVNIKGTYNYAQGDTIKFTSTVAGGQAPYSYSWNFGDGVTSSAMSPSHIYENDGTYTVTLTVTDGRGAIQTNSKTVTISPAGGVSEVDITDISGGFLLSATIISEETVSWSIDVDGMVFFGGHAEGTALGSTQVKLPFSIGFGSVDITIAAGGSTETVSAFMLGPFLLNVQ
jgi:PKD repeat protein